MKIVKNILLIIALVLSPLLVHAATVASPTVVIQPNKIGPGDIITVAVKNAVGPVEGTFNGKQLHFNLVNKTFKAFLGIDLNSEPGTYPLEVMSNGRKLLKNIRIVKKKYPVQRLTLPEDMVVLSPENEARTERDQKKTSAIWPVDSVRIWSGNFIDPLPGKKVGTPFGVRRIINKIPKSSHSGVDLTADEGEPVLAPNDGVAVLVDDLFYSGNSVVLDHGQGIYTMFFHLSKINIRHGQAVMKGDVIAFVGSTGRSTGAHLHWGVRMQGAKVDPLKLIKLKME
ncbi:MAG: M23 family metallopeptidase [Nitrospirae bacterium]|nr:M23 family metallopeptidase [Nitrospirota bacterium]